MEIDEKIYITELPRGYDAQKVYKFLNKHIESDFIKDYIDSSVDNEIKIELIFKRGVQPTLQEVADTMGVATNQTPNYTLISEKGVKVLDVVEEIIEIFTAQRLAITKRRYELLIDAANERLNKNNEIIRFIKEKHYAQAEKKANRKEYVEYLSKKKFYYSEYLADMAIYRMTKEEVSKRQLMIKDDKVKLADYKKILKSPSQIKKKLIEELKDTDEKLSAIMSAKEKSKQKLYKKLSKSTKKKVSKRK